MLYDIAGKRFREYSSREGVRDCYPDLGEIRQE